MYDNNSTQHNIFISCMTIIELNKIYFSCMTIFELNEKHI